MSKLDNKLIIIEVNAKRNRMKLSQAYPLLNIIAVRDKLSLYKQEEFHKARIMVAKSAMWN